MTPKPTHGDPASKVTTSGGSALPALSERQWQQQVIDLATLYRWTWYHTHDSRRSNPGFPDLVLVRDRVLFAELKTDRGRLTTDQHRWIGRLEDAGAEVFVWRPKDLDWVRTELASVTVGAYEHPDKRWERTQ